MLGWSVSSLSSPTLPVRLLTNEGRLDKRVYDGGRELELYTADAVGHLNGNVAVV